MFPKRIGLTLYVVLLGVVLAISALPTAARHSQAAAPRTTGAMKTVTATSTRTIENDQKVKLDGNISRVDGDVIGVVDSGGAETAVLVTPQTEIKSADKHHHFLGGHHGSMTAEGGRSALLTGLAVEVEGRGNCAGQLVAEEIKYRCCDPCGCARLEH